MPFQPVPQTARFDLRHVFAAIAGQPSAQAIVTFYARHIVGDWTQAELIAMATGIGNNWVAFVGAVPGMSVHWTFDRVDARDMAIEFGAVASVEFNTVGAQLGEAASSALAVLCTLHCGGPGAPRRGRMYVPGIGEAVTVGNNVDAATVQDFAEGVDTVRQGIVGGNNNPVRVSRYNRSFRTVDNPLGLRPVGLTNIHTSTTARSLVAIQRRRRD